MQAAIADLFKAFWQTGSAYGVVGIFKDRRFPRRAYGGAWAGELRWGRLTHARVVGVLSNPSYAGAYVFGRYRSRRVLRPDGTITTRTVELPRSEWAIVIQDHHPGLHQLGAVPGQRAAPRGQQQPQRPAPAARGLRAVPGDRALRRVRRVDDHASPPRGQLLRMRPLAR